eukprot:6607941-Prorocentrum_lima.AAC.1
MGTTNKSISDTSGTSSSTYLYRESRARSSSSSSRECLSGGSRGWGGAASDTRFRIGGAWGTGG